MSQTKESAGRRRTGVLDAIGGTPLIRIDRFEGSGFVIPDGVEVYAKAENMNPGGSVKDRTARSMILDGERTGRLTPGKAILDATSGNTGIALAMIGAARGYPVTVCLPANASPERKRTLEIYGATIVETDSLEATDGAQRRAKAMVAERPDAFFYTDQYNNDANWRAHVETTAPEIWSQTEGRVTHFIAGLGTSGTFCGTTRGLKAMSPAIRAISMQPDLPLHGLEGMKHMATAIVPGIYDRSLADGEVEVETPAAQATTRWLARSHGLMVGVSAGANVFAALRLAAGLPSGSVVVTILCDSGGRYIHDAFWKDVSS